MPAPLYDERPWVKNYDPGVPASLHPYPEKSMPDYLRESAQRVPQNAALISSARLPLLGRQQSIITYGELDRQTDELAAALQELGIQKGDAVALVLPNVAAFPIAFYAVLKAGGVVAGINPTYPPKRMEYQINDCDAKIVITLSLFYRTIKEIQPNTKVKHVIATNVKENLPPLAKLLFTLAREKKDGHAIAQLGAGDFWLPDVLRRGAGKKPSGSVAPDDLALLQYTGGTTGVSKGAMLTHRNLVANTLQMQCSWKFVDAEPFKSIVPEEQIFLGVLPLFHAAGLVTVMLQAVAAGARIVLVPNPRDLDEVVDVFDHFKPTAMTGVPALFNAINNHPRIRSGEVSLSSLGITASGAAPLPPAVKREFERIGGVVITEGYGMSELTAASHANPVVKENRAGSVGMPYPDNDVRIVSLDDGVTPLEVGEIGEIIVSAPTMMRGYLKMPTETENALRQLDGKTWMFTGDIGYMDADGYFYIVDRKKDMVIIGGFNVYPTAIEKALMEHPAVLEAGVAGIPHPEKAGQEAIKAWVVLKPGQSASEEALVAHCKQYLTEYELPRRFAFVEALPKSAVGKILRREMIEQEMAERG